MDNFKTESINSINIVQSVVFIDDFGLVVEESKSTYRVTLSGSYIWCFVSKCWKHEIKEIFPKIPLSYILSDSIFVK